MSTEHEPGALVADIDPSSGNFIPNEIIEPERTEQKGIWADLEGRFMTSEQVQAYPRIKAKMFGNIPFIPGMIATYRTGEDTVSGIIVQARMVPDPGFGVQPILHIQSSDGSIQEVPYGQAIVVQNAEQVTNLPAELLSHLVLPENIEAGTSEPLHVGQLVKIDGLFDGRIITINPLGSKQQKETALIVATRIQEYVRQDMDAWVQKIEDPEEREKYRYGLKKQREVLLSVRPDQVKPTSLFSNYIKTLIES